MHRFFLKRNLLVLLSIFVAISASISYADEFTSASYRLEDPTIDSAGYGTSTNFQLWGTIAEVANGTSTSASYSAAGGFLNFPYASVTGVSATPADSAVTVGWSATTGYGGWTVSSYSVGQATVSGGPYTLTNVGNVLSSSRTGLVNGTPYYFVVVANDFFGNAIATSSEVMATPVASGFTFTLNNNTIYFGTLNSSVTKYASSTNTNGDSLEVEANQIEVNTGAPGGYNVSVRGQTLTSAQNAGNIITPLSSNTAPSTGVEQFGLRVNATGGIGSVTAPYAASGFAYGATATTTSQIASAASGDSATTTYSIRYMTNISPTTAAGNYSANLVYVATANF